MTSATTFDGNIVSVLQLLSHIGHSGLAESSKAHLRVWYRGQANKEWKLEPGVYRKSFPETTEVARLH
jgi:hypothetical protein